MDMKDFRAQIDEIDNGLIDLITRRFAVVRDIAAYKAKADFWRALEANKKELIDGDPEKHAVRNPLKGHHRVWFVGMRERKDTHITVEEANVSTISCILGYLAMNNIGRTIGWDPVKHVFTNPDDQKRLYSCFERPQFAVAPIIREIRKKVGA